MAERVQLKVDLEANLGKVVEATKSLKCLYTRKK